MTFLLTWTTTLSLSLAFWTAFVVGLAKLLK